MSRVSPADLIAYGPDANCVLDKSSPYYCPVSDSVYRYRPNLGGNITFMVLFFIALAIQVYQGVRWRTWWFLGAMAVGCLCEILGYAGRIMLWQNPFTFNGFMLQIVMITLGPAFYSAAIYFTLSRIVVYLGKGYSRLSPQAYYYIFIPCDLVSLSLQGTGGGMSSSSSGKSQVGVDIAIAGLSFQVVTLSVFIALATDFAIRYLRGRKASTVKIHLPVQFKVFVGFLSAAIIFILIRCAYRIAELRQGYRNGPLISDEGLFIGLEGVMIIVAAFCLNVAHPGPVFADRKQLGSEGPLAEIALGSERVKEGMLPI
jgi:RTA1 like protein